MTEIHHEIKIKGSPEKIFEALTTNEGLKSWLTPHIEAEGSGWRLKFTGRPAFQFEVTDTSAHKIVAWRCTQGPGDSVGTTTTFALSGPSEGRTLVEFAHMGWPYSRELQEV